MNIIIVGCGKVGQTLAAQLNEEGNNITVVDTDAARVNRLATQLDVMGVTGNGATHAVQSEAGVENADLLIAVTGSDELNMLCCLIAHKESRCKTSVVAEWCMTLRMYATTASGWAVIIMKDLHTFRFSITPSIRNALANRPSMEKRPALSPNTRNAPAEISP